MLTPRILRSLVSVCPYASLCRSDVSCMHLEDEDGAVRELASRGFKLSPLSLASDPLENAVSPEDHIEFQGHFLRPSVDDTTLDDTSVQLPRVIGGHFNAATNLQAFFHTSELLEMGMCGGPALLRRDAGNNPQGGEHPLALASGSEQPPCIGLIEGIVPNVEDESHPAHAVAGNAAIVDSATLKQFIADVEVDMR